MDDTPIAAGLLVGGTLDSGREQARSEPLVRAGRERSPSLSRMAEQQSMTVEEVVRR